MLVGNIFINIILWAVIAVAGVVGIWLAYNLVCWFFLLTALPFISLKKEYVPNGKFNKLYVFGCKMICFSSRVVIHATGMEKVPFGTRFLLISNHLSSYDNVCQAIAFKKEHVCYISKPKNFKIPFAGKYAHRNGFLPLEENNIRQNADTILKAINYIKDDRCSIAVYPEGTRSRTGELQEFKPGSLKIATKAKAPIIVSSIQGTEKVRKRAPWRRTHVHIDVLDVLYPEQYENLNTTELAEKTHNIISQKLNGTN